MGRIRKKTSKRGTTHQRKKIQHKVAETRKKNKKEAKKNPQWKSRKPKDPGIPSNYPFKDQVLAEAAEAKRLKEEERQRKKEQKAAAKATAKLGESTPTEKASISDAKTDIVENDSDAPLLRDSKIPSLKEALEEADVIIQVLDARDPLPFRSQWIEKDAESKGKRIAWVLNKIDLAPRESVAQWASYLRNEACTVLFHASQADIVLNEQTSGKQKLNAGKNARATGAAALNSLISYWASEKTGKEPLRVAFVGMVNSGKSTIINALQQGHQVPVYSRLHPGTGFTTTPYPVRVSYEQNGKTIELIDTPGLMKQNTNSQPKEIRVRDMLFRNKGKVDKIKDPLPAIQYIVSRCAAQDLMLLYALPAFPDHDPNAFLRALARAGGFVQKKGDLDLEGAAKSVLKDWARNKFPFYTLPPPRIVASSDEKTNAIYKEHDPDALSALQSIDALWSGEGLVKFEASDIDIREVILTSMEPEVHTGKETHGVEDDEADGMDDDMGGGDDEDETSEDSTSEESSDASEEEEVPIPNKRKRQAPSGSERHVKKKVAFAKEPPKPARNPKVQAKLPRKVGNAKSVKPMTTSGVVDNEAYDFSKFF